MDSFVSGYQGGFVNISLLDRLATKPWRNTKKSRRNLEVPLVCAIFVIFCTILELRSFSDALEKVGVSHYKFTTILRLWIYIYILNEYLEDTWRVAKNFSNILNIQNIKFIYVKNVPWKLASTNFVESKAP